ncbi:MAG: glutamate synthase-related protein, partial [Longimicrobiales bacterium]
MSPFLWVLVAVVGILIPVTIYDLVQKKHAILRNFPIIGHFRYLLEAVGPELRQYIVTNNNEERPFSRDQRRWVYASAKKQNNYFGFGTDENIELDPNFIIIKHSAFAPPQEPANNGPPVSERRSYSFPVADQRGYALPCAKVMGGPRGRAKAFRPTSIVNVSGMSYGSLSAAAVEAMNRGAGLAGCLQNTGEGGVSPYHQHGGDLIWQIGTGYFGCCSEAGVFSRERFLETVAANSSIKAVEIKMSQGAKPGLGGMLPAAKVSPEIARIRGVPEGKDVISPSHHSAFGNVDELLDFVEDLSEGSGLPIGIKSAVGQDGFWRDLARAMASGERGVDFIAIDGGEGGTGAAPLVFSDHVALPFKLA